MTSAKNPLANQLFPEHTIIARILSSVYEAHEDLQRIRQLGSSAT